MASHCKVSESWGGRRDLNKRPRLYHKFLLLCMVIMQCQEYALILVRVS